jgi:hypothetical protein
MTALAGVLGRDAAMPLKVRKPVSSIFEKISSENTEGSCLQKSVLYPEAHVAEAVEKGDLGGLIQLEANGKPPLEIHRDTRQYLVCPTKMKERLLMDQCKCCAEGRTFQRLPPFERR